MSGGPEAEAQLKLLQNTLKQTGADDVVPTGPLGKLSELLGGPLPLAAAAAGAAIAGFGALLLESAKAAAEEQVGIAQLSAALAAQGISYKASETAIEGLIAQHQKLAFSDDALRESMATLVRHTGDTSKAFDAQAVAMDLARGANVDLQTATLLVSRVLEGDTAILARHGIEVAKGATATEALAAIQKQFGGQAQAFAGTAQGQFERFGNALKDLQEDIGTGLLPVMTELASEATDVVQALRDSGAPESMAAAMHDLGAEVHDTLQAWKDFKGELGDLGWLQTATGVFASGVSQMSKLTTMPEEYLKGNVLGLDAGEKEGAAEQERLARRSATLTSATGRLAEQQTKEARRLQSAALAAAAAQDLSDAAKEDQDRLDQSKRGNALLEEEAKKHLAAVKAIKAAAAADDLASAAKEDDDRAKQHERGMQTLDDQAKKQAEKDKQAATKKAEHDKLVTKQEYADIERTQRDAEDARTRDLKEGDYLRLESLDRQATAEKRGHDERIRQLDDEKTARLDALSVQERQLGLSEQQATRAREDARTAERRGDLAARLAQAEADLQGGGAPTPQRLAAVQQARDALAKQSQQDQDTVDKRRFEDAKAALKDQRDAATKDSDARIKAEREQAQKDADRESDARKSMQETFRLQENAAQQQIAAAREWRDTIRAWRDLGYAAPPPNTIPGQQAGAPPSPNAGTAGVPPAPIGAAGGTSFVFQNCTFGAGATGDDVAAWWAEAKRQTDGAA